MSSEKQIYSGDKISCKERAEKHGKILSKIITKIVYIMYFADKYLNMIYSIDENGYEILQDTTKKCYVCFLPFSRII